MNKQKEKTRDNYLLGAIPLNCEINDTTSYNMSTEKYDN